MEVVRRCLLKIACEVWWSYAFVGTGLANAGVMVPVKRTTTAAITEVDLYNILNVRDRNGEVARGSL